MDKPFRFQSCLIKLFQNIIFPKLFRLQKGLNQIFISELGLVIDRKEWIVLILRNVELFDSAIFQFSHWIIWLVHLIQNSF